MLAREEENEKEKEKERERDTETETETEIETQTETETETETEKRDRERVRERERERSFHTKQHASGMNTPTHTRSFSPGGPIGKVAQSRSRAEMSKSVFCDYDWHTFGAYLRPHEIARVK